MIVEDSLDPASHCNREEKCCLASFYILQLALGLDYPNLLQVRLWVGIDLFRIHMMANTEEKRF